MAFSTADVHLSPLSFPIRQAQVMNWTLILSYLKKTERPPFSFWMDEMEGCTADELSEKSKEIIHIYISTFFFFFPLFGNIFQVSVGQSAPVFCYYLNFSGQCASLFAFWAAPVSTLHLLLRACVST